jgi:hypothetical protein
MRVRTAAAVRLTTSCPLRLASEAKPGERVQLVHPQRSTGRPTYSTDTAAARSWPALAVLLPPL